MNSEHSNINPHVVLIVMSIIIIILGFVIVTQALDIHYLEEDVAHYRSQYIYTSGGNADYPSYQLASFDGGKNWYAIEFYADDWGVHVLGSAEEVYPGLLERIEALDALFAYVEEHGALTLTGEDADKQREILENLGFTVESK